MIVETVRGKYVVRHDPALIARVVALRDSRWVQPAPWQSAFPDPSKANHF